MKDLEVCDPNTNTLIFRVADGGVGFRCVGGLVSGSDAASRFLADGFKSRITTALAACADSDAALAVVRQQPAISSCRLI